MLNDSRIDKNAVLNDGDVLTFGPYRLEVGFVRQAVAVSSMPTTPVLVSDRGEAMVMQGDRRRLARVVANLIDNARLHGGGEPAVYVSEADNEGEPIGHVWIAVEDHGAGVPLDERDLVFERFARGAVAGRRSTSDGAGLGLALVDEHIRMHGGRVWVEDRRDGESGARFVLELPGGDVAARDERVQQTLPVDGPQRHYWIADAQVQIAPAPPEDAPHWWFDPRAILANVVARFAELGLKPVVANELEFYFVDPKRDEKGRVSPARPTRSGRAPEAPRVLAFDKLDEWAGLLAEIDITGDEPGHINTTTKLPFGKFVVLAQVAAPGDGGAPRLYIVRAEPVAG